MRPKAVIDELRKVVWPSADELSRMTGIVIMTVIIFSGIIGLADWGLASGVGRIYNTTPTSSPSAPAVQISPQASPAVPIQVPKQ